MDYDGLIFSTSSKKDTQVFLENVVDDVFIRFFPSKNTVLQLSTDLGVLYNP